MEEEALWPPLERLGAALLRGASADDVKAMVERDPQLLRSWNSYEESPLHRAVTCGASLDVLELIDSHRPDAVQRATRDGGLPLHLVGSNTPVECAAFLVDKHPDALLVRACGDTPLHAALDKRASLEVVKLLVGPCPESLTVPNERGLLPLHVAAKGRHPLEVIRYLANQHPPAHFVESNDGKLPVHHALEFGSADGVIPFLLGRLPPDSVPDAARFGLLHRAVRRFPFASEEVPDMARAVPESLLARDDQGRTPLHVAIDMCFLDLVPVLAALGPEALLARDHQGDIPLHRAIVRFNDMYELGDWPLEVLEILLEHCPLSLEVADADGLLPVQMAASQKDPWLELVQLLAGRRPESLEQKDPRGNPPRILAAETPAA
jgi:ankyrin repeat protein